MSKGRAGESGLAVPDRVLGAGDIPPASGTVCGQLWGSQRGTVKAMAWGWLAVEAKMSDVGCPGGTPRPQAQPGEGGCSKATCLPMESAGQRGPPHPQHSRCPSQPEPDLRAQLSWPSSFGPILPHLRAHGRPAAWSPCGPCGGSLPVWLGFEDRKGRGQGSMVSLC